MGRWNFNHGTTSRRVSFNDDIPPLRFWGGLGWGEGEDGTSIAEQVGGTYLLMTIYHL